MTNLLEEGLCSHLLPLQEILDKSVKGVLVALFLTERVNSALEILTK